MQPCLGCQRAALLRGILCLGKIPCIRVGGAPLEQAVVLKWFYALSHREAFDGGKSALPSALLVTVPVHKTKKQTRIMVFLQVNVGGLAPESIKNTHH